MLPLPDKPTDPIKLADWLELRALLAGDGTSSYGDLQTALKASSVFDGKAPAALETTLTDVFNELRFRTKAAGAGAYLAIARRAIPRLAMLPNVPRCP